ncbi:MAG: diacylglycerol kinase family protein [Verrucomicrobiales bacterium]|nr:diacylglycerol kinase family protein [Verrucomicrobiales bacterium]
MKERDGRHRGLQTFRDAWRGIVSVAKSEFNFRVHLACLVPVIVFGCFFEVSAVEWIALTLCVGFVLFAEILNSALEYLADTVHPEVDPGIGKAKDASAGAVLVASLAAATVAAIIFIPKIWSLLTK